VTNLGINFDNHIDLAGSSYEYLSTGVSAITKGWILEILCHVCHAMKKREHVQYLINQYQGWHLTHHHHSDVNTLIPSSKILLHSKFPSNQVSIIPSLSNIAK
jgi:hypothetical protein